MLNTSQSDPAGNTVINILLAQDGIPFFPEHAHFVTLFLAPDKHDCLDHWRHTVQKINKKCAELSDRTVCVCGVDYNLWEQWCDLHDMPYPRGTTSKEDLEQAPFTDSGGQLWFHIKSDSPDICDLIAKEIIHSFESLIDHDIQTTAAKRKDGKVIGDRFRDAMINPVDPINLSERCTIGNSDAYYRGGAYVIQQKFKHNWTRLDDMTMIEKENMIGRNHDNTIVPMHDDRSHIKCVRQLNGERVTQRILRQAIPYGKSPEGGGREDGIYFVAYTDDGDVYHQLIENIVGPKKGFVKDKLLNNTHAESGNFWFIPPARLLDVPTSDQNLDVPLNDYFDLRSKNGYMFYNNRDYLHKAQKVNGDGVDAISDRIMVLLGQTFSRWNDTWQKPCEMPYLGHLNDYLAEPRWHEFSDIGQSSSAALRKGLAIKISLSDVLRRDKFRDEAKLFNIKPYELIIGNMPPLTLGSGTQVMEYLTEDEKIVGFFGMLNEYSATGHNIPNYHKAIKLGVQGLLDEAKTKLEQSGSDTKDFYQSVLWSLEGLQDFIAGYADLARKAENDTPDEDTSLKHCYREIAERMDRLASGKPDGFVDALQLIFLINCSLHQTGEPMSIGRLDQYLIDAYQKDIETGKISQSAAQEAIDAFWLKMDETVHYNRQNIKDYLTYGTGAVFYSAGNFPQGAALNQWVQQVTLGGYLPTDDTDPKDGCNELTLLCLRAARRLPLNAPCVSLRVHDKMESDLHREIIAEAGKAILSGGAHPILLNDDKLCKALKDSGPLSLADSRDYVCDGCYEPVIQGKSEWAFSYVPTLPTVGMAMNQGATIAGAGWVHLRGLKTGWNSPPPEDIRSFDEFLDIFFTQYKWQISAFYNALMNGYGDLWPICPSPLFSSMTDGCMETGRDMTNGGAQYHIVAPMMCGITNAINALYAIKKMVFDADTAVTNLPELRQALFNNWGLNMQEPFNNVLAGPVRAEAAALRYKELREHALTLPKFGEGESDELKKLGETVVGKCVEIIRDGIDKPLPSIKAAYDKLKEKYSLPDKEFSFTITPGVGTFEDNLGLGYTMGASADGRISGEPIADDFCPSPSPIDMPPMTKPIDLIKGLKDWNTDPINFGLSNAAPIDLNIDENFGLKDVEEVIGLFAKSQIGSNLITMTTADPQTYERSLKFPEKYDLVRVRQGGWSEFFVAMFPEHQNYIQRRPYYRIKK